MKKITHSADWNQTYHTYYNGQQMIEVRNDNSQVLKQYVWGLGYIDELVQVAINQDPANADSCASGGQTENACERFFWALQGVNYNVYGIVSASGDLVERYEYTPYGQRTVYSRGWLKCDLNGDGVVDDVDEDILFDQYGTTTVSTTDINGDGLVSIGDISDFGSASGEAVADDPLVMHSRLESFRTDSQMGSAGGTGSLCDIGHQGLLHDKEFGPAGTGLVHNRARTLNPNLGRFMQRDPAGYRDGMGLYEYVGSLPCCRLDPEGLRWKISWRGGKWATAEAENNKQSLYHLAMRVYLDAREISQWVRPIRKGDRVHTGRGYRSFGKGKDAVGLHDIICKGEKVRFPNEVAVTIGSEHAGTAENRAFRRKMKREVQGLVSKWKRKGRRVIYTDSASQAFKNPSTYGWIYNGHQLYAVAENGVHISDGSLRDGNFILFRTAIARAFAHHRLSFIHVIACHSAMAPWESLAAVRYKQAYGGVAILYTGNIKGIPKKQRVRKRGTKAGRDGVFVIRHR